MNLRQTFGTTVGLMLWALMAAGCGGGAGGAQTVAASDHSYRGTQAPGDVWSYTIGANAFSATNSTLHHDYTGTVQSLPSGFKKLIIATSTDADVHAGDVSYSIEIPSTALVVKPVNGAAVVACGLGDQPTGSSLAYNWIALPELNWTPTDSSSYGTAEFASVGTSFNAQVTSYNADDSLHKQFADSFQYSAGSLIQPDDADLNGAMTPSGTFMLDFGPARGGAIGVLRPAADLDKIEISTKEFIGVIVKTGRSQCAHAQGNGDGTFTGSGYADEGAGVETGTVDADPDHQVHIVLGTQIQPGMFTATLTNTEGTAPMILVVNKAGGKWVMYAFGTDGDAYNVMLVQK